MLNRILHCQIILILLLTVVARAALAADPVKIAVVAPLSGGSAYFGIVIRNGILLAIDEYTVGLGSVPIEVREWDDRSDAAVITSIMRDADQWGAHVVIGGVESHTAASLVPLSAELKIPVITPSATASYINTSTQSTFFFRAITSDGPRAVDLAHWMVESYQSPYLVIYEVRTEQEKQANVAQLVGESAGLNIRRQFDNTHIPYKYLTYLREGAEGASDAQIIEALSSGQYHAAAVLGRSSNTLKISSLIRDKVSHFPIFLLSPGKERFRAVQSLWGSLYAVTDSVIENTNDPRLTQFRSNFIARFGGSVAAEDPIGQYGTFGYDTGQVVLNAIATVAAGGGQSSLDLARTREALRDAIKNTPNDRQGIMSTGGFTSTNELNFVPHRQVLADGVWREPGVTALVAGSNPESEGSDGTSGTQLGLLVLVLLVLLGLLLWQLRRVRQYESQVLTFAVLVFTSLIAAAILFTSLRSYATIRGEHLGVAFEFGGSAAMFIAVLVAGLWTEYRARPSGGPFGFSVVFTDDKGTVANLSGQIRFNLPEGPKNFKIDKGFVVVSDLPNSVRNQTVTFSLVSKQKLRADERSELRLTPGAEYRLKIV